MGVAGLGSTTDFDGAGRVIDLHNRVFRFPIDVGLIRRRFSTSRRGGRLHHIVSPAIAMICCASFR